MNNREVLARLKAELEAVQPALGRVHTTLLAKYKPEDVIADFKWTDSQLGECVKAFIVRPAEGRQERQTTGRTGYSQRRQVYNIHGFVSLDPEKTGTETVLEEDFERIRDRLSALTRMDDTGDTFHLGLFEWTPIMPDKVGDHLVLHKEMTLVIQERRR